MLGSKRCKMFPALLLAGLLLTGCGGGQDDVMVVNLGGTAAPGTPGEERASGGRMRLKPLIYGQLGSEEQLLSGLRRGRIRFANLSAQVTSSIVPELALLYAPFLFDGTEEADYVYDHYLTPVFRELLAEVGLHLVTWYEIGFHSVYAKRPLILPEDAAGIRFRVSSSLNARLFAEAIGADVIPLGFGDIVPALQTGLIDAGENSVSLYARTGIAGEAPHFTLTRHAFGISVIVADKRWWDGLPESDRAILAEAFPSAERSRQAIRAETERDLRDPELGIRAHDLTEEQRDAWKRATADVTTTLIDLVGGRSREIYDGIQAARREFAASARAAR